MGDSNGDESSIKGQERNVGERKEEAEEVKEREAGGDGKRRGWKWKGEGLRAMIGPPSIRSGCVQVPRYYEQTTIYFHSRLNLHYLHVGILSSHPIS